MNTTTDSMLAGSHRSGNVRTVIPGWKLSTDEPPVPVDLDLLRRYRAGELDDDAEDESLMLIASYREWALADVHESRRARGLPPDEPLPAASIRALQDPQPAQPCILDVPVEERCARAVESMLSLGAMQAYVAVAMEDRFRIVHSDGVLHTSGRLHGEFRELQLGRGIVGHVLKNGEPRLALDVRKDRKFVRTSSQVRQELVVPLFHDGEAIGVLLADSFRDDTFNHATVRQIEEIASRLSVEGVNSFLQRSRTRSAAYVARCKQMVEDVLQSTVGDSRDGQAYYASIDHQSGRINMEATVGDGEDPFLALTVNDGTAGRTVRTHRPFFSDDLSHVECYLQSNEKVESELVVPVLSNGETEGVFLVDSFHPGRLKEQHVLDVQKFASHMASS